MRNSLLFLLVLSLIGFSCENRIVFSQYLPVKNAVWQGNNTLRFTFHSPDTLSPYTLSIHFRNDNSFLLDTLLVVAEIEYPSGKTTKDTLQYTTAKPTGKWLGHGLASLTENTLQLRKNTVFPHLGAYIVKVNYAIPKHSAANSLQHLNGITDVGFEIEKSNP